MTVTGCANCAAIEEEARLLNEECLYLAERVEELRLTARAYRELGVCYRLGARPGNKLAAALDTAREVDLGD